MTEVNPTLELRCISRDADLRKLVHPAVHALAEAIKQRHSAETGSSANDQLTQSDRQIIEQASIALTADLAPSLANLVAMVMKITRQPHASVLRCQHSPAWRCERVDQAFVVSSHTVNLLRPSEFLFHLGHALGRQLAMELALGELAHVYKPAGETVDEWFNRMITISADRVGLICCQQVDIAGRSVVKQMTGLDSLTLAIDWAAFAINQDVDAVMQSTDPTTELRYRLHCLFHFWNSSLFLDLFQRTSKDKSETRTPSFSRAGQKVDSAAFATNPTNQIPQSVNGNLDAGDSSTDRLFVPEQEFPSTTTSEPAATPKPIVHQLPRSTTERLIAYSTLYAACAKNQVELLGWDVLSHVYGKHMIDPLRELAPSEMKDAILANVDQLSLELVNAGSESDEPSTTEIARNAFREALTVALADGQVSSPERDQLHLLAQHLLLNEYEYHSLCAELLEPEYSSHPFSVGDPVEVFLDGQWLAGETTTVVNHDELRVRLNDSGRTLKLSKRVDLLRPVTTNALSGSNEQ